jgi:hypothetical protein
MHMLSPVVTCQHWEQLKYSLWLHCTYAHSKLLLLSIYTEYVTECLPNYKLSWNEECYISMGHNLNHCVVTQVMFNIRSIIMYVLQLLPVWNYFLCWLCTAVPILEEAFLICVHRFIWQQQCAWCAIKVSLVSEIYLNIPVTTRQIHGM